MERDAARAEAVADRVGDRAEEAQRRARGRAAEGGERGGAGDAVGGQARPTSGSAAARRRCGRRGRRRTCPTGSRGWRAGTAGRRRPSRARAQRAAGCRAAGARGGRARGASAGRRRRRRAGRGGAGGAARPRRWRARRRRRRCPRRSRGRAARPGGRRRSRRRPTPRPARRGRRRAVRSSRRTTPKPTAVRATRGKDGRDVAGLRGTRSRVRGRLIAGLGMLVVLLVAAPAQAQTDPLERYARGTWASMVAMTDEHTGLPADFVSKDGTRSTPTSPTNIGAYLWSAVAAERLGIIGHREAVARLRQTLGDARDDGARQRRPVLQLVRHPHGASRRPRRAATPPRRSCPRSTTAGSRSACAIVASRVPELRARAQALLDSMDFGFYYRPDVNQILFHYVPSTGDGGRAATTRSSPRAGSRPTSASRRARSRRASTTGTIRAFPDACDCRIETKPLGADAAATSARPCSRARCRTRGCG